MILPARIVFSLWLSLFLPFSSLWLWLAPGIQPGSIYHTWKCDSVHEPDCIMHLRGIFLQLTRVILIRKLPLFFFFFRLFYLKMAEWDSRCHYNRGKNRKSKNLCIFLSTCYLGFIQYLSEKRIKGRLVLALSPDCRFIKKQLSLCQYLEEWTGFGRLQNWEIKDTIILLVD